jgi:tetratricopeptide (TPR) repeat protein
MKENFRTLYTDIQNAISESKITDAFLKVDPFIKRSSQGDIKLQYENLLATYKFYRDYKFKGIVDPDGDKIFLNLQKQLIEILDRLNDEFYLNPIYEKLSNENEMMRLFSQKERLNLDYELKEFLNFNKQPEDENRKEFLSKLFLMLWLSETLNENQKNTLEKYATSKKVHTHEKCVIVSALTIGIVRRFDIKKIHLLFDFYDAGENLVWNRALTGIIMAWFVYEKRIGLYGDIVSRMKLISEDKNIQSHTEAIVLQFARSKETERISKKLKDEIIPEMQKFQPKIQDKLRLDDIVSDMTSEDKNPDWEEIFDEAPGLLDKMADFSKLQLEGSDVFMSAFAIFKQFPFFKNTSNWFLPFYKENSEIHDTFKDIKGNTDIHLFAEGLEKSAFMCNSDKYSFCMNIQMMPDAQRNMLLELFNREIEQMREIGDEDEKLYKNMRDKYIFTQYIQDLYRFYKLHPRRQYVEDFFSYDTNFYNKDLYELLITNEEFPKIIGNLYFQKEFYSEAVQILKKLKLEGRDAQKNFEKIAYAYQKMNNFQKALDNYIKAEVFDHPSAWIAKQTAFCYRKLRDYKNALKYYQIAESMEAENLQLQAGIGHCFLSLGDYENALKKYFKVEFYTPDNVKAMKPIAWCSLMLGNFDTAIKYYQKVVGNTPDSFDLINYGHALYCSNRKEEAVDIYFKSLKATGPETFENVMKEDQPFLLKHLKEEEIALLIDYVKSLLL